MKLRDKDTDVELIARYVAGECSDRERAEVEALVAVDDEKSRVLRDIRALYDRPDRANGKIDIDTAWEELDRRLKARSNVSSARMIRLDGASAHERRSAYDRSPVPANLDGRGRRWKNARRRHVAGIAAVMLAVVVAAVMAGRLTVSVDETPSEAQQRVYATEKGQRMQVRLSDGSQIRLNVDSRLTIPATFGEGRREVRLEGEGYFEVARDKTIPFGISAGDARVEVLGTSFNVRSYPAETVTQVVVADGSVAVQPASGGTVDTVLLAGGEMASLTGEGHLAVLRDVDLERYLAWTEGRLVFVNAPLEVVAAQLEAWYDLEIDVPRYGVSPTFNGSFEDEPLSEILKTVAATLGLEFRRDKRHVTFYTVRPDDGHASK